MGTFAHFRRSEELHNEEIAVAYSTNDERRTSSNPTSERNAEKIERKMLEIENAFSRTISLCSCCRIDFPSSLISVWVLVFVIPVDFDFIRVESIHPCKGEKGKAVKM